MTNKIEADRNAYNEVMRPFAVYAQACDHSRFDLFAEAFTPDGIWVMADGTENHGVEQIVEYFKAAGPYRGYQDWHGNVNIQLDYVSDDEINSTSHWQYNVRQEKGGPWHISSVGTYEDVLKRIDGKWYFSYRKILNWDFHEPAPKF